MATEIEEGDTGVSVSVVSGNWLGSENNIRTTNGSCAQLMQIMSSSGILDIQMLDPSMANNPTNVLGAVKMRIKAAHSGGSTTSNYKIKRSGGSFCAGHNRTTPGGSCPGSLTSYVTCTHDQRPRTIAEAKGTVTFRMYSGLIGSLSNWYGDTVQVQYTYYAMGTPAAPTVAPYASGKLRVTKGSSPTGATHWQVWRSNTSGGTYTLVSTAYIPVGTTTWDDPTDHGGGVTRYYKLKYSANSAGDFCSIGSYGSGTTTTVPGTPGTPNSSTTSSTFLRVKWTAASDGGSTILRYEIDYAKWDGSYPGTWTNAGLDLEHDFSSLTPNTEYKFKVRAVNAIGTGAASEGYIYTNPPKIAPTVTSDAEGRLTIDWSAVSIDGSGSPTVYYDVRWDADGSAGGETEFVTNTTGLTTNQTGLSNGLNRWYDINSSNPQRNSGWGNKTMGTTWDVPTAPGDATFPSRTINRIDFAWTVAGTGSGTPGTPLIDYHYRWKNDGGIYVHVDTDNLNLSAYRSSLSAGTKYWFQIHATNVIGDGTWNEEEYHWTLSPTINAPTVEVTGDGIITISWSNVGGGYRYRVRRDTQSDFGNDPQILTSENIGIPYNDNTPVDGIQYFYRIQVRNIDNNWNTEGTSSDGIYGQDIPDAPSAPFVEATAEETLTINKPSHPPQTGLIGWRIYSSIDGYSAVLATRTVGQSDYDDINLGNSTSRTYKVKFYNDAGEGAKSVASDPTDITWNYPTAPGNCTFNRGAYWNISFNWTPAGEGGGTPASPVTSYHYLWRIDSGGYGSEIELGDILTHTRNGLSAGTKYWFKVHGKNGMAADNGGWNTEQSHYTLCATPTITSVTATTVGELTLLWWDNSTTGAKSTGSWHVQGSTTGNWTGEEYDVGTFDIGITGVNDSNPANGETRYYRIRLKNVEDVWSDWSANDTGTTWNVPSNKNASSATTPENSMIRVTKSVDLPSDGGGTPSEPIDTWSVWRSSTSGGTYSKISGDIATGTHIYDDWTVNGGETWYYKLKYKNLVGDGALSSGYVTTTATYAQLTKPTSLIIKLPAIQLTKPTILRIKITPQVNLPSTLRVVDVPDNQKISSSSTPYHSMIKVFRSGTLPNNNGSTITSWSVWRSSTEGGSYSLIISGLSTGITSYEDWSVNGGETWWYRSKFTNTVGDSALSPSGRIGTATYAQLTQPSNLRIKILSLQLSLPSAIDIKILNQQVSSPSSLKIIILDQQVFLPTSLDIKILDQQLSLPSSLIIKLPDVQLNLPTQLKIILLDQQVFLPSTLVIRIINNQLSLPSSLIINATQYTSLSSTLRVLVWRAPFTPTVTFTRYEKNDSTESTTDTDIDFGMWEGHRTMNAIAVDPFEFTMVNPDKHEFYYAVSPEGGVENFFQVPVTNGFVTIVDDEAVFEPQYRGGDEMGAEQQDWGVGVTEIIALFDIEGDRIGYGDELILTPAWSNTGTVWSPPSDLGINSYDVPSVYNGSIIVVVDGSDWDGSTDSKLHDWLPFQINAGHAVEVSEFTMISGTHVDNIINLHGNTDTLYTVSLKVYHESPKEWEWWKAIGGGSYTMLDSGELSTDKNIWQFLNNLDLRSGTSSGSLAFQLRLYSNSGSIVHPNPVRVVTVNRII